MKIKSDFDEYLDRYAKAYSKPVEAARNDLIPKMVEEYYRQIENDSKGQNQAQEGGCDGDKKV